MKYYFLCLWLAILRTLQTWWMYIILFALWFFSFNTSMAFLVIFVIGTKLARFVISENISPISGLITSYTTGESEVLRPSELSYLQHQILQNSYIRMLILITYTIFCWGGAILFLIFLFL
jgi:hypothetical protein